jgi:hypothetical protein
MSAERDELADVFAYHPVTLGPAPLQLMKGFAQEIADKILAAGYRKPRTITTVEELDALVGGVVILSAAGVVYVKEYEMFDPGTWWWVTAGAVSEFQSNRIALPATVLHEGDTNA